MRRLSWASAVTALAVLLVAGCSAPDSPLARGGEADTDLAGLLENGVPADALFSVLMGQHADLDDRSDLLFVGADGRTTRVDAGSDGAGEVTAQGGDLCLLLPGSLVRVGPKGGERIKSNEHASSSGPTAVRSDEDGQCVGVSNYGFTEDGYVADVTMSGPGVARSRFLMEMDVPSGIGARSKHVWARSNPEGVPDMDAVLYKMDRTTGDVAEMTSWEVAPGLVRRPGTVGGWGWSSDLFEVEGRLVFLEEFVLDTDTDTADEEAGEDGGAKSASVEGSSIGLATVDPRTGAYRVVPVRPYVDRWTEGTDGEDHPAGFLLSDGHLYEGRLWVADGSGDLIGIDVETGQIGARYALSEDAAESPSAAEWREGTLHMVVGAGTPKAAIESYDLDTGRSTSVAVPDLTELASGWDVHGLAALR